MTATATRKSQAADGSGKKPHLVRLALSNLEFKALEVIGKKYGHDTASGSVRFALEQQSARDDAFGTNTWKPVPNSTAADRLVGEQEETRCWTTACAVRETVGPGVVRESAEAGKPVELREWSLWLWDRHQDALAAVMKKWKLESRVDAFRMAIRTQAQLDGYVPQHGWVKPLVKEAVLE